MAGVDARLGCLRLEQYRAALDDAVPCMYSRSKYSRGGIAVVSTAPPSTTQCALSLLPGLAACSLVITPTSIFTMFTSAGLRRRLVRRGAHERSAARRARCSRQHDAMWKAAARRLRPSRPPARPASTRSSSGRPQFPASLGDWQMRSGRPAIPRLTGPVTYVNT